jgi:PqqA peptide cyclase
VRDRRLSDIWLHSEAFQRFRGTHWMPEPCRSCELREVDWGGCRCQALAFAGDAALTDPACGKSSLHDAFARVAEREAALPPLELVFRNPRAGTQL